MLTGKSYGVPKLLIELIQGSTFLEIAKEPHSLLGYGQAITYEEGNKTIFIGG